MKKKLNKKYLNKYMVILQQLLRVLLLFMQKLHRTSLKL